MFPRLFYLNDSEKVCSSLAIRYSYNKIEIEKIKFILKMTLFNARIIIGGLIKIRTSKINEFAIYCANLPLPLI